MKRHLQKRQSLNALRCSLYRSRFFLKFPNLPCGFSDDLLARSLLTSTPPRLSLLSLPGLDMLFYKSAAASLSGSISHAQNIAGLELATVQLQDAEKRRWLTPYLFSLNFGDFFLFVWALFVLTGNISLLSWNAESVIVWWLGYKFLALFSFARERDTRQI